MDGLTRGIRPFPEAPDGEGVPELAWLFVAKWRVPPEEGIDDRPRLHILGAQDLGTGVLKVLVPLRYDVVVGPVRERVEERLEVYERSRTENVRFGDLSDGD